MKVTYIQQTLELLKGLEKEASIKQVIDQLQDTLTNKKIAADNAFFMSPEFHNIISLLTPFITVWKVNQAISLLKELGKEFGEQKSMFHHRI